MLVHKKILKNFKLIF